jgi:predicted deacylase
VVKPLQRSLEFGGETIPPGTRATFDLPLSMLSTHTQVNLPVQVIHGRRPGPRLLVTAAVHGDELNGVEIIRRLLLRPAVGRLAGTLIAVPIVNVYGFIGYTRYLPDRRDLNRSFPGSANGSLASQLAHLFNHQVLAHATHAVDLHTGAIHRTNLPQIRGEMDHEGVHSLMRAFGAPVMLDAPLRPGSLRSVATERGIPMVVYESGEALRFDEFGIRTGLEGVLNIMTDLEMIKRRRTRRRTPPQPVVARSSYWVRAPAGGVLRSQCTIGEHVREGQVLGLVADPMGRAEVQVKAGESGVVIGHTRLPVTNQGDALIHIARVRDPMTAAERIESFQDVLSDEEEPWPGT